MPDTAFVLLTSLCCRSCLPLGFLLFVYLLAIPLLPSLLLPSCPIFIRFPHGLTHRFSHILSHPHSPSSHLLIISPPPPPHSSTFLFSRMSLTLPCRHSPCAPCRTSRSRAPAPTPTELLLPCLRPNSSTRYASAEAHGVTINKCTSGIENTEIIETLASSGGYRKP